MDSAGVVCFSDRFLDTFDFDSTVAVLRSINEAFVCVGISRAVELDTTLGVLGWVIDVCDCAIAVSHWDIYPLEEVTFTAFTDPAT